jgi:hypothetical protein
MLSEIIVPSHIRDVVYPDKLVWIVATNGESLYARADARENYEVSLSRISVSKLGGESQIWTVKFDAHGGYFRFYNAHVDRYLRVKDGNVHTEADVSVHTNYHWQIEPSKSAENFRIKNRETEGYLCVVTNKHNRGGGVYVGGLECSYAGSFWKFVCNK